jgi:predicted nucleic acid-binding protein
VVPTARTGAGEYLSLDAGQLAGLGLQIRTMSGKQVLDVVTLRQQHARLSANDLFAYVPARDLEATLLTGDSGLRQLAADTGVPCHGTLWLLDGLVQHGLLQPHQAAEALTLMLDKGSRLPAVACNQRLRTWRND